MRATSSDRQLRPLTRAGRVRLGALGRYALRFSDTWPALSTGTSYYYVQRGVARSHTCKNGSHAIGSGCALDPCAHNVGTSSKHWLHKECRPRLETNTGFVDAARHKLDWELTVIAPRYSNGYCHTLAARTRRLCSSTNAGPSFIWFGVVVFTSVASTCTDALQSALSGFR